MNSVLQLKFWRKHGVNILVVVVSLLALAITWQIHSQAKLALQAATNSYQQQQASNIEAEQSAAVLRDYLPVYRAFQAQGLIGVPQRLQWLETLNAGANQHLIPRVSFSVLPTAIATATNTTYMPDTLVMKVTPMRLDFTLLHEGDFYRLMEHMQHHAKGLFSTEGCEIQRTGEELAGFKGHCALLWYSLADMTQAWEVLHAP